MDEEIGALGAPEGDAVPADIGKSASPRKKPPITSIDDLLSYAYAQGGRTLAISRSTSKTLAEGEWDMPTLHRRVEELAQSDPLLKVPPRLLVAMEQSVGRGRLRKTLLDLVHVPLARHPAFNGVDLTPFGRQATTSELRDVLSGMVAALDRSEAVAAVAPLKPRERRTLRSNAVLTAILIIANRDDAPLDRVADTLDAYLWQHELARTKVRSERALLAESTSPATLGLLARAWSRRLHDQSEAVERADAERRFAEATVRDANARLEAAESAKAAADQIISERNREIEQLRSDVAHEQDQRAIARSHAVDDYERLRTRSIRALEQQSSLLEDGLHALRNDSGHVTAEYIERVIDAIAREVTSLRSTGNKADKDVK